MFPLELSTSVWHEKPEHLHLLFDVVAHIEHLNIKRCSQLCFKAVTEKSSRNAQLLHALYYQFFFFFKYSCAEINYKYLHTLQNTLHILLGCPRVFQCQRCCRLLGSETSTWATTGGWMASLPASRPHTLRPPLINYWINPSEGWRLVTARCQWCCTGVNDLQHPR